MTDTTETITHANVKAVQQDTSNKARSMAREVDRLPPGVYFIRLHKPALRGQSWELTIDKAETVRTMELKR